MTVCEKAGEEPGALPGCPDICAFARLASAYDSTRDAKPHWGLRAMNCLTEPIA